MYQKNIFLKIFPAGTFVSGFLSKTKIYFFPKKNLTSLFSPAFKSKLNFLTRIFIILTIMIIKIEHVGIAIKNMETANKLFSALLALPSYKMEEVKTESVMTSFFKVGESKIELLEALDPESPVSKFIDKRGEGMHHLALEVEDIGEAMRRVKEAGFILLSDEPKRGADNKLICFLHPKSTNGVLIELCQEIV
jgi:methylmalonyl-CoA/ethylmalonyl-CoA epimerase